MLLRGQYRKGDNRLQIQTLGTSHDRNAFDCGTAELNIFLKTMAKQAGAKRMSQTFVLTRTPEPAKILGYFSLTICQVNIEEVPERQRKRYPPQHGLHAIRLARLAVSLSEQKKGLGGILLADAMLKTAVAELVGGIGLFVDAKDENAIKFYLHYGFVVTNDARPMQFFLPTASLPTE
jgi:GNAT superfamily N-acetyltransferase